MNSRLQPWVILFAVSLAGVSTALAQPIINVPGDPAPSNIGGTTILNVNNGGLLGNGFTASGNSTVNLFDGGTLRDQNVFRTNSEFNMFGGRVSGRLSTRENAIINMSGGTMNGNVTISEGMMDMSGGDIQAALGISSVFNMTGGDAGPRTTVFPGGTASIRGGTLGGLNSRTNSSTSLFGSEFLLNSVPITGLNLIGNSVSFNLPADGFFSGVLADGTPFFFSAADGDQIEDNTLTLVRTAAAPPGPANLDVPTDFGGWGVRSGQTVTVRDGGVLSNNFNAGPGSTVIVDGGFVGQNFEAIGAQVTLLDGGIGRLSDAFAGSTVVIENGRVGEGFEAWAGSSVVVNGGVIVEGFQVKGGADLTINGGNFGTVTGGPSDITTLPNSLLTINNGTVGEANVGGLVIVSGGDIRGLGVKESAKAEVHGGNISRLSLTTGELLMTGGTLGDQSNARLDSMLDIRGGTVGDLFTLTSGSQLNLRGGTIGNQFRAVQEGSMAIISGGTIGDDGSAETGAVVTMTAGAIGKRFVVEDGATVTMIGGTIGKEFLARDGATVNIEGGFVDISLKARSGSVVNISGGQIAGFMVAESGATVNISGGMAGPFFTVRDAIVEMDGGEIGPLMTLESGALFNRRGGLVEGGFSALAGSILHLFGQSFTIDGVAVSGLDEFEDSLVLSQRGGALLEGMLADGSLFQLRLNGQSQPFQDFVDPDATLRLTLVPEPGTATLLLVGAVALLACRRLRSRG